MCIRDSQWGVRRFLGMPSEVPFNKSHVEVGYADANYAHWSFCDPVEGRLPEEGTDEAATDTHVLELMGVTPEVASEDACKVEHDLSEETFGCIQAYLKKMLEEQKEG